MDGLPAPRVLYALADAEVIRRRCVKVRQVAEALESALRAEGLHPLLMKGPGAAAFYPEPDLRTPGDIDFFLEGEEFRRVASWAEESGGPISRGADGSVRFCAGGVDIDLHPRFFEGLPTGDWLPAAGTPEATLLMLSIHIFKHIAGPGAGLRQLCDLGMAYRTLEGTYARQDLLDLYKKAGLMRWNRLLCTFLRERLGLETGLFPKGSLRGLRPLERIVFSGGDLGRHHPLHLKTQSWKGWRLKVRTLSCYLRHAPFALCMSPGTFLRLTGSLVKGNLFRKGL